jgi:hypothetical protein
VQAHIWCDLAASRMPLSTGSTLSTVATELQA